MMRHILMILLVLVVGRTGTVYGSGDTPRHPDELALPDLVFDIPEPVETRLSNGIRVLLFENHDLPLINLSAYVSMGDRFLPPDRHTANRLLSRVWDDGGIGTLSPDEVATRVAALGMSLSAGVGDARAYVQASMVRDDLAEGAVLWRDLLRAPRFDDDRMERAKARLLKDVQGINDNPDRLAETWFHRLLSGPESPEGRVHTRAGIEAVTRDDVLALYGSFVLPERVVVGVSGDIELPEAVALLESQLGDWRSETEAPPLEPYIWERTPRPGVFLLPGDFEQCHLRMGRGVAELTDRSADYPETKLLDFGVGYMRVYYRTRGAGLSYGTSTRLTANESRGRFWAWGSSRSGKIVDLITAVREEVADLSSRPLNDGEVATARTFIIGSLIRRMETARDVVSTRLDEISLGRPDGYTADLIAGLQAATGEQVAAAAARYAIFGDAPVVLIVGNPEGGVESLESLGLGPVTVLDPIEFGRE